ncbi:MAG TPA: hypothetical protein V6C78_27805 [Crinalium sp.]|jgi:hypothetical protein
MTDFQSPQMEFLTPEESAEVDKALMTARDRFSTRVALYSLRALKQVAQEHGMAIADLSSEQIEDWIYQDPSLQPEKGFDGGFKGFFTQLVMSSLKPLKQMARETGQPIESLTLPQVVDWFEQEAKRRIELGS